MANHGTDPSRRFSIMRERVEAMRAIWTEEEAEYHGEHVDFDSIWCHPKPLQRPHPPVLVGGLGEKVYARVIAYGDAWFPILASKPEALGERIGELQRRAAEAGRERIPVTLFGTKPEAAFLERLRTAGVDRTLFLLPSDPPEKIEGWLDGYAAAASEFRAAG